MGEKRCAASGETGQSTAVENTGMYFESRASALDKMYPKIYQIKTSLSESFRLIKLFGTFVYGLSEVE